MHSAILVSVFLKQAQMENYELKVKAAVEKGEKIFYVVTPIYEAGKDIPTKMHMFAKGEACFSLNVTIINSE